MLLTIRQLGNDDFDVREQASDDLMRAGLAALPILRAAGRDPDVEIARRIEICLNRISQDQETSRIGAAAYLLAHQKADGIVATLFAYLPCVPEDEAVFESIRIALTHYTKEIGKADPLLIKALHDRDVNLRALALQVLAESLPAMRPTIREMLTDAQPKIRYLAASILVKSGDEESLPALLKLLTEGPSEYAFQVEDLLCQLLDTEERPPATLSGGDRASRDKVYDAWKKWIDERIKGKKLNLARLNEAEPMRVDANRRSRWRRRQWRPYLGMRPGRQAALGTNRPGGPGRCAGSSRRSIARPRILHLCARRSATAAAKSFGNLPISAATPLEHSG